MTETKLLKQRGWFKIPIFGITIHENRPSLELQQDAANLFNPCWDASRFVLHPSTERGIFTPDAGPDLTQRAKKILSKTLNGASGVRDPCAIAD